MLVIIDHRKAIPWVRNNLSHKLTRDSMVLTVTRRGLIKASENAQFLNGNIDSVCLRSIQETGSCLEYLVTKEKLLLFQDLKSLHDLRSTLTKLLQQYNIKSCTLVSSSDHLSSAAMVSTFVHLNLPTPDLNAFCLYDPSENPKKKFFKEAELGLPMFYIREYFRTNIQSHIVERFKLVNAKAFEYFNPISIYILNETNNKNIKASQLGQHTLRRFGTYHFIDSCLRSVDLSFTLAHLEKQGLITIFKGDIKVTREGFEIASIFDKGAVDRCIYAMLQASSERFAIIDRCLKKMSDIESPTL